MSHPPPSAELLFYEGNAFMGQGDTARAEQAFRDALRRVPTFAEAHANLGLLLDQTARFTEAEICYRRALELAPWQTQTYLNFGAMLAAQKRFIGAETAYRQALEIEPGSASALSNLGVLLACMRREEEAEQCYRTALQLTPDHRNAVFNLAYLLLRQGRYEEGWRCLEARDWYACLEQHLNMPRWKGEPLEGKAVLIGFEAGQGDMIQFCRYGALLKKRHAVRVSVLCHPGLKTLFAGLDGVDDAIGFDDPIPQSGWDYWSPPLSLPFYFQTRLDSIPARLPYITADPSRVERWAASLADSDDALRVGLVWKGNPKFENDAERSLASLEQLATLGALAGVRFFSLQKGEGEQEVLQPPAGLAIRNLAPDIADFADTAAIIVNLDLVIAVDTAVAHLAGALGKPCWVLLPDFKTDWRWLKERDDSPWYPGVLRLFRQQSATGWEATISRVKTALHRLVAERRARG